VILAHIHAPPPTLEESAPDLIFPARLSEVLSRSIAKDSSQRYDTMQEFKKALAEVGHRKTSGSEGKGEPNTSERSKGRGGADGAGFGADGAGSGSGSGGGGKLVVNDEMSSDFQKLLNGSERGDVEDQYDLAWNYRKGEGGAPKDPKMAFYWFLRAAQQDKTQAMNCVSDMYQEGEGVMQDYHESFTWRRRSTEAGDTLGQWNLGWLYQMGYGCECDPDLCAYWYRKAADQGHDVCAVRSRLVLFERLRC
jgi:TPR repeat protein